jgi:site-specific recombinase XerD
VLNGHKWYEMVVDVPEKSHICPITRLPMFILHTPKSDKPTPIILKKVLSDGPFRESLGLSILPALWDKENERAVIADLDKATAAENKSINATLKRIFDFVDARARDARYTGNQLTCEEMAAKLAEITGKTKIKKGAGFYPKCRIIIGDMESGKLTTPRGKKYSAGTIKNYNQSLNTLEEYNGNLNWANIDMKFYRTFVKWCNDKDFSLNYIAQHIKNLVRLMRIGKSKSYKYHSCTGYMDEDFKVIQEQTDDIALYQKELDAIANKHIPNKYWDIARDWFVLGCYLGLRVSDVKLLDESKNFSAESVTIANEKTDTKVVVPINDQIRAIRKKWNGLPPKMHEVEINRHIKKVCEIVGLTEPFLYFLTKGGTRKDFYLRKCDMVSCHTMRRFFITELIRLDVRDNKIMQLAGIKKHATLLRYKKISPEENALNMQGQAFFK